MRIGLRLISHLPLFAEQSGEQASARVGPCFEIAPGSALYLASGYAIRRELHCVPQDG